MKKVIFALLSIASVSFASPPSHCVSVNKTLKHCFFNGSLQAKRLDKLEYLMSDPNVSHKQLKAYEYEYKYITSTGKLLTPPELDDRINEENYSPPSVQDDIPEGVGDDLRY